MAYDDDLEDLIDELEERYPELDHDQLEAIAESMLDQEETEPSGVIEDLSEFVDMWEGWDYGYDEYDVEASPSYGEDE